VRVEALEVTLEVVCAGPRSAELRDAVEKAWAWCLTEGDTRAPHRLVVVLEDDDQTMAASAGAADLVGTDLAVVMDRLSPMITGLAVTEQAGHLTMFHACGLADVETGAAAVLFGPSGTGKTTLARTLGNAFVYLSDETAAVSADRLVLPYPKPLSILTDPGSTLKQQVSPGELGLGLVTPRAYPLRSLVQLHRVPEHEGEVRVDLLSTVEALPEMISQTSYTRQMDRPLQHMAGLAHHVGGVRRVTYRESAQLEPVVRSLLAEAP
jgi:energy-coupling factor transporter ATP-binding protein EcfA2